MSDINSSAYYSVGNQSSSSHGISGLMSGMDSEAMVDKMLAGTQAKIDKQLGIKQQMEWKQEFYRESITSINSFHSTYFDVSFGASSENNFASDQFFNSMSSSVNSGDALQIINTTSEATEGELRMAITQLATSSKLSSSKTMSGEQKITGEALNSTDLMSLFNKEVTLKIGASQTVSVDLNLVKTEQDLTQAFQSAIQAEGITDVTAEMYDGKIRFISEDPNQSIAIDQSSTELGLRVAGLQSPKQSDITNLDGSTSGMLEGASIDLEAGISFDLTLDGVQKTINLNNVQDELGDGFDVGDIKTALESKVQTAFGDAIKVSVTPENGLQLQVNIKDAEGNLEMGHELIVTGVNASDIGLRPGASTLVSTSTEIGDLGLKGDSFSFSINGEQFTFTSKDSLGKLMNTVNQSDAGVRITYSSLSDTFNMEATSSGARHSISLTQETGNLLGAMFGNDQIAAASTVSSSLLTTGSLKGQTAGLDAGYTTEAASLSMRVNDESYTFSLPQTGTAYTKETIEQKLNAWLEEKFGSAGATPNISYANGELTIQEGFRVSFEATTIDQRDSASVEEAMKSDLAYAMGFNRTETSNAPSSGTVLITDVYELQGITASEIRDQGGSQATTLDEIATIGGHAVTFKDGRLELEGAGVVDLSSIPQLSQLFGGDSITLGNGDVVADAIEQGVDAKIVVNGVETSRSSNTFTVNGITMEAKELSEDITINTKRDVDSIVDGFKAFVKDYNDMIETLNDLVTEKPDYKKYPPLTDAQRKEMSEKEIELWEKKSKTGLLRNDDAISGFLAEMRKTLYEKPVGSDIALYSIGIETTTDYNDGGKIQMDESLLREALATDPDGVRKLFTDSVDGLAGKISTIVERTANESLADPGWLVQMAGVDGHSTEKNNTLYRQMNNLESRISSLKLRYEKEKTRYWKQFDAMESIMANFNAQSMMLSQEFGGY